MNKNRKQWFQKCVMFFSLQEREQRGYIRYMREHDDLKKLSVCELSSRYITVKAKYEYKKNVFSCFVITVLMATIMGTWERLYTFCKKGLELLYSDQGNVEDVARISFIIAVIVLVFTATTAFILLIACLRELYFLHRQLLIIEEVRESHK